MMLRYTHLDERDGARPRVQVGLNGGEEAVEELQAGPVTRQRCDPGLPARCAAHLVRQHEYNDGRALDGLREVRDGDHVARELDVGQILDVDVVGVDNLGQLAALDLLLVHPHLNPSNGSVSDPMGPAGKGLGPGRRRQGPGNNGGHRPHPAQSHTGPQRPIWGAERRTLTVSWNWSNRTVLVPTMRATAEPLCMRGQSPSIPARSGATRPASPRTSCRIPRGTLFPCRDRQPCCEE